MCDHNDDFDGIDAREMSILLGISEELVQEEQERHRLLEEIQPEEDDDSEE